MLKRRRGTKEVFHSLHFLPNILDGKLQAAQLSKTAGYETYSLSEAEWTTVEPFIPQESMFDEIYTCWPHMHKYIDAFILLQSFRTQMGWVKPYLYTYICMYYHCTTFANLASCAQFTQSLFWYFYFDVCKFKYDFFKILCRHIDIVVK